MFGKKPHTIGILPLESECSTCCRDDHWIIHTRNDLFMPKSWIPPLWLSIISERMQVPIQLYSSRSASGSACLGAGRRGSEARRAGVHEKPLPDDFSETFLLCSTGETLAIPMPYILPLTRKLKRRYIFLQILWKGRWVSRPIKLFSTTTHIKWDAAVTMQDVVSMENRQTGHDSVIWYRRADLVLHEKFQFCFPL